MTERSTGSAGASRGTSAREAAAEAGRQAKSIGEEVAAAARDKGEELKERAQDVARERQSEAAEMIGAVATALHSASRSLHDQRQEGLGRMSDEIADQVDRLAQRLHESDTSGILDDLERFGRDNPAALLATAFLGGLVAGRFLRSSSADRRTVPETGVIERERPPAVYREPRADPDTMVSTTPSGRGSPMSGGANE